MIAGGVTMRSFRFLVWVRMRHGTNTSGESTSRFMIRAAITRPMCHRVQERHFLDLGAENKGFWPVLV